MLGIRYISFDSMRHVIHYKKGKIKKEGKGLAFYYCAPSSSIVAVPLGSADLIYVFNLTTADFQTVTVQGQITYRVSDPRKLAELLDFTVDAGGNYLKNDIEKLDQRLINEAQTAAGVYVQGLGMKEAIGSAKAIEGKISEGLSSSMAVQMLGIQPLSVLVLGVSPSPEMARALEAQTRESLQKEADEAIYSRRNFAVEQERIIKESELSTEIAVEQKKKQIAEKRMEAEVAQEENRRLREMKVDADVSVEE
ncbi:MAG TPA: membrane protease subunit, stomatin/prohibitin, partial [Spirochaetes bacterium]|nr:membrane protease subunit, stomatin/prohibitin [Spirochaetota bacterium]